ncbi:MmyB family transcriptional regulator [Nocardia niigatensis]
MQFIKDQRLRKGFTVQQMADMLYISKSGYEKIESDTRAPTTNLLHDFSNALELTFDLRRVMWMLAMGEDLTVSTGPRGTLSEGELRFMNSLPGPAFLQRAPTFQVYALNAAAKQWFPWLDPALGSPGEGVNTITQMMTDPRAQQIIVNWFEVVARLVYALREYSIGTVPKDEVDAIRRACQPNPVFEQLWTSPLPDGELDEDTIILADPQTGEHSRWQFDIMRWSHPFRDIELFSLTAK